MRSAAQRPGRRRSCRIGGVSLLLLSACGSGPDGTGPASNATDDRLPSVEVISLDTDTSIDLADIEGPAVINVWATTCPPCVREMPALQAVADERPDVAFYGLNVNEPAGSVIEFVERFDVTYPQLLDDGAYAAEALAVDSMPTTFVVGADDTVTLRHRGEITADQLRAGLPTP